MRVQLNLSTAALENKRPFLVAASVLGAIGLITFLLYGHAAFSSWNNLVNSTQFGLPVSPGAMRGLQTSVHLRFQ